MKSSNLKYWLLQIFGWGFWCLFGAYLNLVVYKDIFIASYTKKGDSINIGYNKFFGTLLLTFIIAILVTHLLRFFIRKMDWLRFAYDKLFYSFIVSSILTGFLLFFFTDALERVLNVSLEEYRSQIKYENAIEIEEKSVLKNKDSYWLYSDLSNEEKSTIEQIKQNTGWSRNKQGAWSYKGRSNIVVIYQSIILIALWLLIYIVWHFIERNRKDQLDRLKLESTVKALELKTIKAHINPHFIFNSLNSIRALVDENPERARRAITELSNLLRSSMQAEKNETVPLEKEMKIVEDYLALEKIRFEDRLNIEYAIDEDTLDQEVPYMMVQTLVENAIKHGISKQIKGGTVKIHSDFVNSHYELKVENSGLLLAQENEGGFGLKSTQDRINLLFGEQSKFAIVQKNDTTVEVTICLPVKINT